MCVGQLLSTQRLGLPNIVLLIKQARLVWTFAIDKLRITHVTELASFDQDFKINFGIYLSLLQCWPAVAY